MRRYLFLLFVFLGCGLFLGGIAFLYRVYPLPSFVPPAAASAFPLFLFVGGCASTAAAVYCALSLVRDLSVRVESLAAEVAAARSQARFLQTRIPRMQSSIEALSAMREIGRATTIHVEFEKILEEVLAILVQMTGAALLDIFLADPDDAGAAFPLKARFEARGEHGYFYVYFDQDPAGIDFSRIEIGDCRRYRGETSAVIDATLQYEGLTTGAARVVSRLTPGDMKNQELFLRERVCSLEIDAHDISRAVAVKNILRVQEGGMLRFTAPLLAEKHVIGVLKVTCGGGPGGGDPSQVENLLRETSRHISLAIKKAELYEKAVKDGLTNLYNKGHFINQLNLSIATARSDGTPFSLLLFDIDHFKKVNDTYGHLTGDIVLRGVALVLRRSLREHDMAFRYGGEELAIILNNTSIRTAGKVANRIRKAVKARSFRGERGERLSVTVSVGVSQYYPDVMSGPEALISRADQGLYTAKERGRDRVIKMNKPRKRV